MCSLYKYIFIYKYLFDENSFEEFDSKISPDDALEFEDTETYKERIKKAQQKTKQKKK